MKKRVRLRIPAREVFGRETRVSEFKRLPALLSRGADRSGRLGGVWELMDGGDTATPKHALESTQHADAVRPEFDGLGPDVVGLSSLPFGRHGAVWFAIFSAAACSLALMKVWQHRYDVSSDGLSYLDMAEAFSRRDWATAANATWSPLYPFLVGLVLALFHPGPATEGPAVQVLNLAIFVLAGAAFAFLFRELERYDAPLLRRPVGSWKKNARWGTALALVAAVVFTQSAVEQFIRIDSVSPDLCVAAAFFWATALVVRILRKAGTVKTYLALGAVLGLGYLAKSVFFPLALLFVIAAFAAGGARSKAARGVGISVAVFVLIAAPWIVLLSLAKGRFTLGEAGRLNYAWYVSGVSAPPRYWQGGPDGTGTPVHPARVLERVPEVYELDRPMRVTYPAWYDPSYWYEGVRARFDARRQAAVIAGCMRWYAHALAGVPAKDVSVMQATVVWGLALLLYASGRGRGIWADARRYAWILLPTVGGLGLYGLIQVQGRYVGAMVAVLFLVGFAMIRLRGTEPHRLVTGVVAIVLVVWAGQYAYLVSQEVKSQRRVDDRRFALGGDRWPLEVADGLRRIGVRPGARVAVVATRSTHFYWARLAGVRIVAELRDGSIVAGAPVTDQIGRFWLGEEESRRRVLHAFRRAGVEAVVTDARPADDDLWRPLARSGFFARVLKSGETR